MKALFCKNRGIESAKSSKKREKDARHGTTGNWNQSLKTINNSTR